MAVFGDGDDDGLVPPYERLERANPDNTPPSMSITNSRTQEPISACPILASQADSYLLGELGNHRYTDVSSRAREYLPQANPESESIDTTLGEEALNKLSLDDANLQSIGPEVNRVRDEKTRTHIATIVDEVMSDPDSLASSPPQPLDPVAQLSYDDPHTSLKNQSRKDSSIDNLDTMVASSPQALPSPIPLPVDGLGIEHGIHETAPAPSTLDHPQTPDANNTASPFSTADTLVSSPLSPHLRFPDMPDSDLNLHPIQSIREGVSLQRSRPPTGHARLPSIAKIITDAGGRRYDSRRRGQSMSSVLSSSSTLHSASPWSANSPSTFGGPTSFNSPRYMQPSPIVEPPSSPFAQNGSAHSRRASHAPDLSPRSTVTQTSSNPFSASTIDTPVSSHGDVFSPKNTSYDHSQEPWPQHSRPIEAFPQPFPNFMPPFQQEAGPGSMHYQPPLLPMPLDSNPTHHHPPHIGHPTYGQIEHVPAPGSGGYKCSYVGCTAPPFQTQYLLNSHATVHSDSRPHYCPIASCSRSMGGKGFKRKNEMIRHGLVHESPKFVCPFCAPDREHRYPRPDNLQRHIKAHHPDIDKDDPRLKTVLAQKIGTTTISSLITSGSKRGRRKTVSDIQGPEMSA